MSGHENHGHEQHGHEHHGQETRIVERHADVCVVGGSAAGLAAALQLGRQRRSVIVIDSGEPRNRPAAHMHSYLSREGLPPAELVAVGREEVRSYGGEILPGTVTDVRRTDDGDFRVALASGHTVRARRVLAATGLVDELPDIDGVTEQWGRDVIHCPFCHGYEVRDQRVVVIVTHPMGLHPVRLFHHLTSRLTVVLHEAPGSGGTALDDTALDNAGLDALRAAGVTIVRGQVSHVVTGADGHVTAVSVAGHGSLDADAVVVGPRFKVRVEPFASLGLRPAAHPTGLGDFVETDPAGQTSVPGLYAAGNVTDPSQQVLSAAADGSRVGAMIAFSLADEDVREVARTSANQADWDQRYSGERLWSGNPNGTVAAEASALKPGRVLDVGAGEGGDAIWLAANGWDVTANDISQRALDRVTAEAARQGLQVTALHADANAADAFPVSAFDLVTAAYASVPRTPDDRAVRSILGAVAPGGTLLIVSHDIESMRASGQDRAFDADAYVRVEDFVAALAGSPDWDVEVNEKRPRPAGHIAASHHVDDIVLRARRSA